ncbi:Endochitinase A [Capsicum annuum]|nr:Endochitinase A [Capsicum annuum]KAF3648637.1 Endochitinase A [Capsicum annuum]
MKLCKFTVLSLLFSLLFLTVSTEQCGKQAGDARRAPGLCCNKFGWCDNTNVYCGPGNCQSQCPSGPTPKPPTLGPRPGGDISGVISNSVLDQILKHRNDNACQGKGNFYNYNAFINAVRSFCGFGTTRDIIVRKREIAQTSHESTVLNLIALAELRTISELTVSDSPEFCNMKL